MIAIPALDLREGACVQLVGGSYDDERVREADPLAVARRWRAAGFRTLHVVDLDAATGRGDQTALVARVLDTWAGDVQVGGGLRDDGAIERVFAAGASRAVVGTRAVEDCTWLASAASRWPGRIVVALDARGREVLARGWTAGTGTDVVTLAAELSELPLAGLLVTAVANEGRLAGPDLETTSAVAAACSLSVTASGGIASPEDLRALAARGARAAVLGMALYTGALDPRAIAEEFHS
ncbi:MAG: 1-(5-phosphoribosyl)-5-[(5-phosphoribosylamino)methylideneamino] imidazole-4-carboxamide isomerase [Candidatus Eisenbacteria bacterium]|uniref:1-(5-phosphoribosyl)-5-[(5-phosphoribosylamino)methylideneamino] imidazole-4-carboxamide isomerase n=1 Tax=Eiseniibacteriota bacterium TaxID=2212470 RepID=A0A933SGS7_UNCEI|nr:1-(5-phosphoribosyl)-5-[(5-phosphoribosylamino)methylideneamino] imidazole-4-carboxamide isomerase [Candidatus Eisenbacteria bacterium]